MKLILEIDFEEALLNSDDGADWTLSEHEENFMNEFKISIEDIERDTGTVVTIKDENGKTIYL